MRLRKKPWIAEAINQYNDFVYQDIDSSVQGRWQEVFSRSAPLHVELGTGKGRFITETAALNPDINYIGIEAQLDVLFYAAQKAAAKELKNIRLLVFDINNILDIFADNEIDQLYINFCDPWPKARHAKRRLTHINFLNKYRQIIKSGGRLFFKTDNKALFEFSLEQFAENGLIVENVTFDLHNSEFAEKNIMTEYEQKFSGLGMKIHRCEVVFP
ncbi:MAG: tRNA (guanosine(46)-N7)-methyltransferase TrmB [Veillonellaceae bacterium]|nr:tRNA (guanosine(46)-N7)-methyltransferase TrmB [Veillonellaceae bacterium]